MTVLRLHIGTHKTGSTSIQRWLADHRDWLADRDYAVYHGLHLPANHIELYLAAMRPERDSFAKRSLSGWSFDTAYAANVGKRVRDHLASHQGKQSIFSSEGLSLLRHEDELRSLRAVLGEAAANVSVLLFLREKQAFLGSYRAQLLSQPGRFPAADYWSALYVEEDSWLIDYDQLLGAYGAAFGRQSVTVIDYDDEVARRGSVLPSFLEWLQIPQSDIDMAALDRYRFNVTSARDQGRADAT